MAAVERDGEGLLASRAHWRCRATTSAVLALYAAGTGAVAEAAQVGEPVVKHGAVDRNTC